jgi:hypothetical protein
MDAETLHGIRCHRQDYSDEMRYCHEDCAAFSIEDVDDEDDDEQVACCWGEVIGVME